MIVLYVEYYSTTIALNSAKNTMLHREISILPIKVLSPSEILVDSWASSTARLIMIEWTPNNPTSRIISKKFDLTLWWGR